MEPNTQPTQSGERVSQGLQGVREKARKNKQERFTALLHHVNVDLLRESYYGLKRQAAPGVDGVTWKEYERAGRSTQRSARPDPPWSISGVAVTESLDTEGQTGSKDRWGSRRWKTRSSSSAVGTVLNQIYEEDFRGFTYGFRPGRSQHRGAGRAVGGDPRKKVNWILDIDMKGFFDNIDKEHLMEMVGRRIADTRILRLIQKWLKAGIIEEGVWSETEKGTPQGAVISPLLANIYLHYVLDQWTDQWRKSAQGDVIIVRYADEPSWVFSTRAKRSVSSVI